MAFLAAALRPPPSFLPEPPFPPFRLIAFRWRGVSASARAWPPFFPIFARYLFTAGSSSGAISGIVNGTPLFVKLTRTYGGREMRTDGGYEFTISVAARRKPPFRIYAGRLVATGARVR
jgi:hypothetical protein